MSAARSHRIGSIFTRLNGLIQKGVVKHDDRPVWFDVYKAFPPKRDPSFRTVLGGDPQSEYKPPRILYYEDQIRARYYQEIEDYHVHDLTSKEDSVCDKFIKTFYELSDKGISEKNLFEATYETLKSQGTLIMLKKDLQNSRV